MPRHLARAMYDQLEDTLSSITRARACKGICEVTGTRSTGTTLMVSLPMPRAT
jgi:hypothetical protein